MESRTALISIHPEYAEKIFAGKKEDRIQAAMDESISGNFIYIRNCSCPTHRWIREDSASDTGNTDSTLAFNPAS
jgi:hypothetical protein